MEGDCKYDMTTSRYFLCRNWQRESKRAAGARCARRAQISTHASCQIATDGQTEPRPFVRTAQRSPDLHERLEDVLEMIRGNADAGIRHNNVDVVRALLTVHRDFAPRFRELHGVREEIEQYLAELRVVGGNGECRIAFLHLEVQPFRVDQGQDECFRLGERIPHRHRPDLVLHRACLESRVVQHFIDEGQQMPLAVLDALECRALCGCDRTVHTDLEELGVAGDRVEGRAQLMAHGGQEVTLAAVGGLGFGTRDLRFPNQARLFFLMTTPLGLRREQGLMLALLLGALGRYVERDAHHANHVAVLVAQQTRVVAQHAPPAIAVPHAILGRYARHRRVVEERARRGDRSGKIIGMDALDPPAFIGRDVRFFEAEEGGEVGGAIDQAGPDVPVVGVPIQRFGDEAQTLAIQVRIRHQPTGPSVFSICSNNTAGSGKAHYIALMRRLILTALLTMAAGSPLCAQHHEHAPAAATAGTGFTVADVHFMQHMIGHHAQAIQMAELAPSHGASPSVLKLAQKIHISQRDEIGMMTAWLTARKQPVPAEHDSMAMMMPGMLTPAQFAQLGYARGPAFDRLFLSFMIRHHEGALQMVQDLFKTKEAAQDPDLFRFVTDVDADQRDEIYVMEGMLSNIQQEKP